MTWSIRLDVTSRSEEDAKALMASLVTECDTIILDESRFAIDIVESTCKDLRAMWNTRVRGLIAVDNVLQIL